MTIQTRDVIIPEQTYVRDFEGPFDEALKTSRSQGYSPISTAEVMKQRIKHGGAHYISQNGSRTQEAVIYNKGNEPRIVRVSPLVQNLELARQATQASRTGTEVYLTPEQFGANLVDSFAFPSENIKIPTNRLGEDGLTVWLAGNDSELAKEYGQFLREAKIKEMPVWAVGKDYVANQPGAFARQIWFGNLPNGGSDVGGNYWGLDGDGTLRGVRKVTGEASSQNFSSGSQVTGYQPADIQRALETLGFAGLERQLLTQLEQKD